MWRYNKAMLRGRGSLQTKHPSPHSDVGGADYIPCILEVSLLGGLAGVSHLVGPVLRVWPQQGMWGQCLISSKDLNLVSRSY